MSTEFKYERELRFWCQKVLPLVYDDSLSYYELLCKVVAKLNTLIENNNHLPEIIVEEIKKYITPEQIEEILSEIFDDLRANIAVADDHESTTATADRDTGDWVWLNDELYYVVRPMNIGDAYIIGGENPNVARTTVEQRVKYYVELLETDIVDKVGEEAQAREDADDAIGVRIDEVDDRIDDEITNRTNADDALDDRIDDEITNRTNADDALDDRIDGEIANRTSADDDIMAVIGSLSDLETPVKTSIVNSINSVQTQIDNLKSTIYINVKDYGAKGDGVTDDTDAINTAKEIAESYEHGATLFFPAGTYVISSTLTFTYHSENGLGGVSILGEGNYSSIITSNSDIDLIVYNGDDTVADYGGYLYGVCISNIYLFNPPTRQSSSAGLKLINCGMVLLHNVRIRYFLTGVYLSACGNSTFFKVDISANVVGAHGFDTGDRSVSNAFIACTFSASGNALGLNANSYGFYASRGNISDQNIIYFDVANATAAVYINGINTTENQTGDINIIDLVCETWYGIMLYNMARHGNVNIIGGWFNCKNDTPRSGIFITNCNGVSINSVTFVNNIGTGSVNGKNAISLADANSGSIKVVNCLIKNQNAFNGGLGGGAVMFNNNFIHNEGSITSDATCVYINAKNSIAVGNVFRGTFLRYIRFGASATYSLCANNVGAGGATGTAFENNAGSTTVFDNNVNG